MKAIISDPKMLCYVEAEAIIPWTPSDKALTDQIFPLKMDDAVYGTYSLPLQKDSEFLPLFNHYIMKMIQSGLMKRLYLKYHGDFYVKREIRDD